MSARSIAILTIALGMSLSGCLQAAGAEVRVDIYQYPGEKMGSPRLQYIRGEHIPLRIAQDSTVRGGNISLSAQTGEMSTVVWQSANDRKEHSLFLATDNLRSAQYKLVATVVSTEGATAASEPLSIGINLPIRDAFPVFTFSTGKYTVPSTLDGLKDLVKRYREGGYNQFYFFQSHDALLAGGRDNPNLVDFMNYCINSGVGLVPMTNTFLYGLMDDQTCSVTGSGNFPTTYVYEGTLKRMTSVLHPRHVESVKDRLRDYLLFAKHWPCIRGINLDDEPSATFYNYFEAGRFDLAPKGEKWWGNGDYNAYNVSLFKKRYGSAPPRYALARELRKKYPAGTVVSVDDPWFRWMTFTGNLMGDYYAAVAPTCKEVAPDIPRFSQPFIGLAGSSFGCEWRHFHSALDKINFHYISGGHPTEGAASAAILSQSISNGKPVLAMIHSVNFGSASTPEGKVYDSPYVMQQFWSCIGVGVKGIGDQGEADISLREDTWQHWTKAARDVTAISPLLLRATRAKSSVALLYSVESEWMQSAYLEHPLEIWRQHHTFEMMEAALQRASIPFDIVTTLDVMKNPRALDPYRAVICAAMDYARQDVFKVISKAGARVYVTPESALKPPAAKVLKHNFNEVYRLFLEAGIRDPRTYDQLIDDRAKYLRRVLGSIPRYADSDSPDISVYVLNTPGAKLVVPVNCGLNWMFDDDPSQEVLAKVRNIVGNNVNIPKGAVHAAKVDGGVRIPKGRHAYDLRENKELVLTEKKGQPWLACSLDGGEGTLVLVTPTRIAKLEVSKTNTVGGFRVTALDKASKRIKWALPVDVKVVGPDQNVITEYCSHQLVENGSYEGHIDWATNDASGKWTVSITELASGKTARISMEKRS